MPYGYFQFVRLSAFISFLWLANKYKESLYLQVICIGCAILFNPLFKVSFPRKTWNTIDVIIAIGLVIWAIAEFVSLRNERKETHKEKAR